MASNRRSHFADPLHPLLNTPYSHEAARSCNICLFKLTGLDSHHCNACHIHIHKACADYFDQTIDFFAHPWHRLTLRRVPSDAHGRGRLCDLCLGDCPPGSFAYSCITCSFDVHPLCSKLRQTISSSLHPGHELRLLPSSGNCAACRQSLPVWHYRCSCSFRLHIACAASDAPTGGSYSHGISYGGGGGGGQSDIVVTPSHSRLMNAIAKFLLKTSFHVAINAATGGLASPLAEVLSAALDFNC